MAPQVAVVSGGASGMGRIYALRMARAGVRVAVLDHSEAGLTELANECGDITPYPCDVTDLERVKQTVEDIEQRLGPIDRLAHCAAIMPAGTLATQAVDSIHLLMSVNYGGTVNVVTTVLPGMQARNSGEIVVFGSLGGHVPVPECGAYCASKSAVNAFTEILIEENRGSDVHIMLVCPSLVNTPLLEQATDTGNPTSVRYSIEHKRFAQPDSIIDAIENGLKKRKAILYPNAEAKILAWLRRFSPGLMWKIIHASNKTWQSK
jgi:NADP-dependent 3-hydroxy acid dehydrogenase YdfG